MKRIKIFTLLAAAILISAASLTSVNAQPEKDLNSARIKIMFQRLNVLGSVLYVAAHPDDENNALLAYFNCGKHYRTGYLSLTRGDGGQNLVGTEQGDLLGILRTQELLQARKIDGAKQFFSRSIDFGYSKSAKETLDFWNKEKILSDVVWVIRKFRPDVIVTRFPGTGEGGHGNHTASELLAAEAFKIAGDSTKFPGQLKYVKPWQPERIVWNAWLPLLKRHDVDLSTLVQINVGSYNPLLGESYNEIAAESRSMHKSQGFGSSYRPGESINYFKPIDGKTARKYLFEDVNTTWSRVKGGERVGKLIAEATVKFDPVHPDRSIPGLIRIYDQIGKLPVGYWVNEKKKEVVNLIKYCSGLWLNATASEYSAAPGDSITVTAGIQNRSSFPFILKKIGVKYASNELSFAKKLGDDEYFSAKSSVVLPDNAPYSQPYWLKNKHGRGNYVVDDQQLIGKAENDPPLTAEFTLTAYNTTLKFSTPVYYQWTDPVKGEEYRPFIITPPVTLNLGDNTYVFPDGNPKKVNLMLTNNTAHAKGVLKLDLPDGWRAEPANYKFNIDGLHNEKQFSFSVYPPPGKSEGELKAEAVIGKEVISKGIVSINHPYFPIQTYFPPAVAKIVRLDIKKVVNNIGYIMGPGDKVPDALEELGYNVTMLDGDDIENGNLSKFDAVITGIRLYNTNKRMKYLQPKLLNYVKNGGTLVVQYNKNFGLVTKDIGPYPFHISRDRVTDEDSKVTFTNPDSRLLNYPNKITGDDFNGWIQERGVYFPDKWDPKYKTVIACHDPGEADLDGGLLYTSYGKGIFIYTGYDWFRELPAGVPGAFRLFVNLISAGQSGNTGADK